MVSATAAILDLSVLNFSPMTAAPVPLELILLGRRELPSAEIAALVNLQSQKEQPPVISAAPTSTVPALDLIRAKHVLLDTIPMERLACLPVLLAPLASTTMLLVVLASSATLAHIKIKLARPAARNVVLASSVKTQHQRPAFHVTQVRKFSVFLKLDLKLLLTFNYTPPLL